LWTRMLWTADVSATTIAKPLPTNPKTHSIDSFLLSQLKGFLFSSVESVNEWILNLCWKKGYPKTLFIRKVPKLL
jgi:hypothetical protein